MALIECTEVLRIQEETCNLKTKDGKLQDQSKDQQTTAMGLTQDPLPLLTPLVINKTIKTPLTTINSETQEIQQILR